MRRKEFGDRRDTAYEICAFNFNETFAYGSGAKNYGFEKFYPKNGLTTEEYSDRLEKWMRLMKGTTRK